MNGKSRVIGYGACSPLCLERQRSHVGIQAIKMVEELKKKRRHDNAFDIPKRQTTLLGLLNICNLRTSALDS